MTGVLTTEDALALLRAIDEGRDENLPILADLLEEAGDLLADGVRLYDGRRDGTHDTQPEAWGGGEARWYRSDGRPRGDSAYQLAASTYDQLEELETWARSGRTTRGDYLEYESRSAAILALAAVLSGQTRCDEQEQREAFDGLPF